MMQLHTVLVSTVTIEKMKRKIAERNIFLNLNSKEKKEQKYYDTSVSEMDEPR